MITLVKKTTIITEFGDNLEVKIEGLLSNGATLGVRHSFEAQPGQEKMVVIMKHETLKINCNDHFEKDLERILTELNNTSE